jgi:uncharacterized protein (DUF2267 family)
MEELINQIVKKTGLPREMAQKVVAVVIEYIKKKLPAPVAAQVEAVLGGKVASSALAHEASDLLGNPAVTGAVSHALDDGKLDAQDAANLLGDLFGGKKK